MEDKWKTKITTLSPPVEVSSEPACMVLIYPTGDLLGKRFTMEREALLIGRTTECDIVVELDSVSRRHARIQRERTNIVVHDLGSTNGTYVNQVQIKSRVLSDGDQIKIGNAIFKFLSGGNVESGYHEAIYRMVIVDGLTEVHNKRYFLEFLERELARSARYKHSLSLVMYDLDHFKNVNDTYGHLAGDHVLREISRRLHSRIRREELLARYGGEEFVILLPETDSEGAISFAEHIRERVEAEPVNFEGEVIKVTISVGVATIKGETMDTDGIIRMADENLYEAKRSGRNRVVG
jgi:two-component system, cell cycle response regulator